MSPKVFKWWRDAQDPRDTYGTPHASLFLPAPPRVFRKHGRLYRPVYTLPDAQEIEDARRESPWDFDSIIDLSLLNKSFYPGFTAAEVSSLLDSSVAQTALMYAILYPAISPTVHLLKRLQAFADLGSTSFELLLADAFERDKTYRFEAPDPSVQLAYVPRKGHNYSRSLSIQFLQLQKSDARCATLEIPFTPPKRRYVCFFFQCIADNPHLLSRARAQISFSFEGFGFEAGFTWHRAPDFLPISLIASPAWIDLLTHGYSGVLPQKWVTTVVSVDLKQFLYDTLYLTGHDFYHVTASPRHWPIGHGLRSLFQLLLCTDSRYASALHLDNIVVAQWGPLFQSWTDSQISPTPE